MILFFRIAAYHSDVCAFWRQLVTGIENIQKNPAAEPIPEKKQEKAICKSIHQCNSNHNNNIYSISYLTFWFFAINISSCAKIQFGIMLCRNPCHEL